MDNENLTNQQSLDIIQKMISTAKGNVCQGAFHMILWGWVVIIMSTSHFLLLKFQVIAHPEMVWLASFPALFISMYYGYKQGRSAKVTTYLDRIYMWVWMGFIVTMTLMFIFIFGSWQLIHPMVLILAGYATFLSGTIIKFKPMILGAVSLWAWSIVAFYVGPYYGMLVTSAAITTGYLIPGYLLKRKSDES